MKRTTKDVALDVHQATTVAAVREETGRVIARAIRPPEDAALVAFFWGMRGAIHGAFEEGTQAQWLHDLLAPLVHRVVVCDRRGSDGGGTTAIGSMPTSWPTGCGVAGGARCITAARTGPR